MKVTREVAEQVAEQMRRVYGVPCCVQEGSLDGVSMVYIVVVDMADDALVPSIVSGVPIWRERKKW